MKKELVFTLTLLGIYTQIGVSQVNGVNYQSIGTQVLLTKPQDNPTISRPKADLIYGLSNAIDASREIYEHKTDRPGDAWLGGVSAVTGFGANVLSSMGGLKGKAVSIELLGIKKLADWNREHRYGDIKRIAKYEQRSDLDLATKSVVIGAINQCNDDIKCARMEIRKVFEDEGITKKFLALGYDKNQAVDEALGWANLEKSGQIRAQLGGLGIMVDNVAMGTAYLNQKVDGVIQKQEEMAGAIATTIHLQKATLASVKKMHKDVVEIKGDVKDIQENVHEIKDITQKNLDLTIKNNFILENIEVSLGDVHGKLDNIENKLGDIDLRLENVSKDVSFLVKNELKEKYASSPTDQKIKILMDPNDPISTLFTIEERNEQIEMLKIQKRKEEIISVCNDIQKYGEVAKEAYSVICQEIECPEEIKEAIKIGFALTDIVGNITTGNWSGAAMAALGIFKKPEPSPELKMLNKISEQVNNLEQNMNVQFKAVHDQLFSIEENLGNQLQLVDAKIDELSIGIKNMHYENLETLTRIDSKIDYLINQNECIKDLVLQLSQETGQDLCKATVEEFKKRISLGEINNYDDLNNFFRGGVCQNCIQALFEYMSQSLVDKSSFRFSSCLTEGESHKAHPQKVYEFIFNELFDNRDVNATRSLLFLPTNVRIARSFKDSVLANINLNSSDFNITQEDKYYRNFKLVIEYVDYLITMLPFLELYENTRLLTPDEIEQNPGFVKERSQLMVRALKDALQLLEHTIFQQSLMSGNGTFEILDRVFENNSIPENWISPLDNKLSISELFEFNPYLKKNYTTYIIDKYIGMNKLIQVVNGSSRKTTRFFSSNYNIKVQNNGSYAPDFELSIVGSTSEVNKLASGMLQSVKGKISPWVYESSMQFVFSQPLVALYEAKDKVNSLIAEFKAITSPLLDQPNTAFSRSDLKELIQQLKNQD